MSEDFLSQVEELLGVGPDQRKGPVNYDSEAEEKTAIIDAVRGNSPQCTDLGLVRLMHGSFLQQEPIVVSASLAIRANPWAFLRLWREMGQAVREYNQEVQTHYKKLGGV